MTFWFSLGPYLFIFIFCWWYWGLNLWPLPTRHMLYRAPIRTRSSNRSTRDFTELTEQTQGCSRMWEQRHRTVRAQGCENRGTGLWGLRMAPQNTKDFSELPLRLSWARLHTSSNPAGTSTCLLTVASQGQQVSTLAEGPPTGRVAEIWPQSDRTCL